MPTLKERVGILEENVNELLKILDTASSKETIEEITSVAKEATKKIKESVEELEKATQEKIKEIRENRMEIAKILNQIIQVLDDELNLNLIALKQDVRGLK